MLCLDGGFLCLLPFLYVDRSCIELIRERSLQPIHILVKCLVEIEELIIPPT